MQSQIKQCDQEDNRLNENRNSIIDQHHQKKQYGIQKSTIYFLFAFFLVALYSYLHTPNPTLFTHKGKQIHNNNSSLNNPKILWLLTQVDLDNLKMIQSIVAQHLIHVANNSGFQVRIVNCITAYDWLSPQMTELVRQTKHKSKLMIQVYELIRLALLIEHGGLSVRLPKIIFPQRISWIIDQFNRNFTSLKEKNDFDQLPYYNSHQQPQVMLFYHKKKGVVIYQDEIIYATKNSTLLKQTLQEMSNILTLGNWPFTYLINIEDSIKKTHRIPNLFAQLVNFKQSFWLTTNQFCQYYRVHSLNKNTFVMKMDYEETIRTQLMRDKQQFISKYGRKYVIEANLGVLSHDFKLVLNHEYLYFSHNNSIFRSDLVEAQGNRWMMVPINKTRTVSYCIISLKPTNNKQAQVNVSITRLKNQTYKNWRAIFFINQLQSQSQSTQNGQAILVRARQWQGFNLQMAATRYCSATDVAILLDYDESLGTNNDLTTIQKQMDNTSIYGIFLSIRHQTKIMKPKYAEGEIRRKINKPDKSLLEQVKNHFRVFTINSYRYIPHMALHDQKTYFDREIALLTLLEMGQEYNKCEEGYTIFHTKQIEQKMEIPKYRKIMNNTYITLSTLPTINISKQQYHSKHASHSLCSGLTLALNSPFKSFKQFFILNNGTSFTHQNRTNMQKVIPAKIHQIILVEQTTNFKKLSSNIKQAFVNYQYNLWTKKNITQSNFPISYDIIKTLMQLGQDKIKLISSIMRAQIVYNHGGIFIDNSYFIINNNTFDHWLTYNAVIANKVFPFHRFSKDNSLFAAIKGSPYLKRLIDHRTISLINPFLSQANVESSFFSQTIIKQQEFSLQILQPSLESIRPFYYSQPDNKNLCEKDKLNLMQKTYQYKSHCQLVYPWAVGINLQ